MCEWQPQCVTHVLLYRFGRHKHKHDKEEQTGPVEKRRVVAFIGGLDLTDGRYDTPEHRLFSTLKPDGVNCNDFYQPSIEGVCGGGGPVSARDTHHLAVSTPVRVLC